MNKRTFISSLAVGTAAFLSAISAKIIASNKEVDSKVDPELEEISLRAARILFKIQDGDNEKSLDDHNDEYGYGINIEAPYMRFFVSDPYGFLIIKDDVGGQWSFDGLGWADEAAWLERRNNVVIA